MNTTLWLLLLYSVLQVALGLWIGRRVKSAGDFFVAGRSLGPFLLFATMVAANIGAGSTVGAAGLGYRDGLSAWWWVGSAGIGSLVLAFTVGPSIWRQAKAHDLRTVGDYLERRYNSAIRGVVAALLWLATLAILAGQLIALSRVLSVVAGVPKWAGCLVGGVVMMAYFTAGGLLSSAWVNAVQLCVLLFGFMVAVPVALAQVGGVDGLRDSIPAVNGYSDFFAGGGSGIRYLALLAPAFIVSPGLLQKIYGARDERAVRWGVAANGAVLLGFAFIPPILGMCARALHPSLPHHEEALPTLLALDLPPAFGALGLAAVVSAEVSTADAILFMLATSLSQDLYRRFLNPAATDAQVLKVSRIAAVAGGTLGVCLALVASSVIAALGIFYTLLGVCLFVPVAAGLYLKRFGTPEAATALVCGVALMLAVHFGTGGAGYGALSPALVGIVGGGVLALAAMAVRRPAA